MLSPKCYVPIVVVVAAVVEVEVMSRIVKMFMIVVGLSTAAVARSATVYNCTTQGHQCVVKVESGIIGDRVRFLDDKAMVIASGRIIKKRGNYALVTVTNPVKHIRRGFPVIVDIENRGSSMQWAASFSGE